jgi:hypothetical protein
MNSSLREPDFRSGATKTILLGMITFLISVLPMEMNAQKNTKHLAVSLVSESSDFELGSAVVLTFSVKNNHKKAVSFCEYMTPFEGFNGPILKVLDQEGKPVQYVGVMRKRSEPGPDNYIHLESGESESVQFDLLVAYPIKAVGNYTVQFIGNKYMNALGNSEVVEFRVR